MTDLIIGIVFLTALAVVLYLAMQHSNKIRRGMIDELEDEEVDEPAADAVDSEPEPDVKPEPAPAPEPKQERRGRPKKKKD
jgi:hypothetical protein